MEDFERSDYYEEMADSIMQEEPLLVPICNDGVKIVCVCSDKVKVDENKKAVFAECEKIPPKFKWATNADCMITVYKNNVLYFSEEQKRIMLFRELLKIECDAREGIKRISIRDYDLKDFRCIVERYGANWSRGKELFDEN